METLIKLCGTVIIALTASLIVKEKYKTIAYLFSAATFIIVLLYFLNNYGQTLTDAVSVFSENTLFSGYAVTLTKALGIAYVSAITSSLCEECGEKMLSSVSQFAGKMTLIILSLPSVFSLLELASGML